MALRRPLEPGGPPIGRTERSAALVSNMEGDADERKFAVGQFTTCCKLRYLVRPNCGTRFSRRASMSYSLSAASRTIAMVVAKHGTMREKTAREFLATIYRIWMLRYVDVPEAVVMSLVHPTGYGNRKKKTSVPASKYIPVIARVNGHAARTTLLPAGGGRYRMQFNAVLRKAACADVGDVVRIELSHDRDPRELSVPDDLRAALNRHTKASKAFENAPPGLRRQMLKWMDSAKSEPARMRRIEAVIDRMLERAILGPRQHRQRKN